MLTRISNLPVMRVWQRSPDVDGFSKGYLESTAQSVVLDVSAIICPGAFKCAKPAIDTGASQKYAEVQAVLQHMNSMDYFM